MRFPILRIHRQESTAIKKKTKSFLPTILRPNFQIKGSRRRSGTITPQSYLLRGGRVSYIRPALPRANPEFFQVSSRCNRSSEIARIFRSKMARALRTRSRISRLTINVGSAGVAKARFRQASPIKHKRPGIEARQSKPRDRVSPDLLASFNVRQSRRQMNC